MNKQLESPFTSSHWFFGGSILIASSCFHLLSTPYFLWIYCVVFVSLLLDWMSAYQEREKTDLVLFLLNLFAVFNYVSMFISMTLKMGNFLETYVLIHYFLIFVNYILWNVYISKKINIKREKKFLIGFSVVQSLTIIGFVLGILGVLPFFDITFNDITNYVANNTYNVLKTALVLLSIFHILIMGFWINRRYNNTQSTQSPNLHNKKIV